MDEAIEKQQLITNGNEESVRGITTRSMEQRWERTEGRQEANMDNGNKNETYISQSSLRSARRESSVGSRATASFSQSQTKSNTNEKKATAQRKRSRTGEADEGTGTRINELLQQIQNLIEQVVKKGDKGKNIMEKIDLGEMMRELSMKNVSCTFFSESVLMKLNKSQEEQIKAMAKLQSCMEEVCSLQQQVVTLQHQLAKQGTMQSQEQLTYLQGAAKNIAASKQLPMPTILDPVKIAPSERILIFKAKAKGLIPTKEQQENFRTDIRRALGEALIKQIEVIRPTRYGGYMIIFQNEDSREEALSYLRVNEMSAGIDEKSSCIRAPRKKLAKALCREPLEGYTPQQVMQDFYGSHNMYLHQIPISRREARIFISAVLGWIFELSSEEAVACHAQNGRVRFGYAREIKVEEFIPLQQCYKYCMFGHNAIDCLSEREYCRLYGEVGHVGKNCPKKDKKEEWKCINCKLTNESGGYKLPTDHAAAQLHKCPCAQNQKLIKKEQLSAAGVFTTPIIGDSLIRKQEKQANTMKGATISGGQKLGMKQGKMREKSRSKSQIPKRITRNKNTSSSATTTPAINLRNINISASSTTAPASTDLRNINFSVSVTSANTDRQQNGFQQRTFKVQRPRSTDGWKMVGKGRVSEGSEQRGRGEEDRGGGTNSTSNLPRAEREMNDTQMQ